LFNASNQRATWSNQTSCLNRGSREAELFRGMLVVSALYDAGLA